MDDTAIELGQLYRSAAILVADTGPGSRAGADLPAAQLPAEWAGQPGTRAPHLWLGDEGREISALDLFRRDWTLLSDDDRWAGAAMRAADHSGVPVAFVHIGTDAKPEEPTDVHSAFGIDSGGATLVRPDGYIAWRAVTPPDGRTEALAAAVGATAAPARVSADRK